jgi:hypothetical protein
MATLFPTSLDALHNPHSSLAVNAEGGHAKQHVDANDAIEALQAKVGINGSAVTTSLSYKIATLEAFNNNLGNTLDDYVPVGDVGQADGVASLDSSGRIPLAQLANLVGNAPLALDTLNELAAALNNDANFAGTITTSLSLKAPLASPTFTGTVNLSSATVTGVISTIQQNGSALTKRPVLNFLGGALVEDDLVNNRINVTITGGIPELIDSGNFDSVSPYDGGAPDATIFENTFDAGEIAA